METPDEEGEKGNKGRAWLCLRPRFYKVSIRPVPEVDWSKISEEHALAIKIKSCVHVYNM